MPNHDDFAALFGNTAFPADRTDFFRAHLRPGGRPWSFEGHEYLEVIVADEAVEIAILKAAQLGLSTTAIGRCLHDAGRKGLSAAHFLPDRALMQVFVQDRVDALINADETLARVCIEGKTEGKAAAARARSKSADNTRLKHLGQGSLWYQGLQTKKDAKAITYDSIVLDELDELDPELVPWLDDRLLHSSYKRRFALSQPSVPEFGIHAQFLSGDQKYFLLKCSKCRRWCNLQEDWPDCLALKGQSFTSTTGKRRTIIWDSNRIICKRCGSRISIREASSHEWVAKHPGRDISTYSVSQLYGPHCDADEVARRWHKAQTSRAALEALTISVVGLPHAGDRQPINDEVLANACGDWQSGPPAVLDHVFPAVQRKRPFRLAGIDTGDVLHAVAAEVIPGDLPHELSGSALVFEARIFSGGDQWDDLAAWLLDRGVTFFVIDAAPYTTNAKNLLRVPGLNGAMARFTSADLVVDFEEKQHPRPARVVRCDRTDAIDELADALVAKATRLPSARLDVMTLVKKHCKALVKDISPTTGRYQYKKHVENHFGLALTYLQLARRVCEMLGLSPREPYGSIESHVAGEELRIGQWE